MVLDAIRDVLPSVPPMARKIPSAVSARTAEPGAEVGNARLTPCT
jgi:hypothetical protein